MALAFRFALVLALVSELSMSCPDEKNCLYCQQDGKPKDTRCMICENGFWDQPTNKCTEVVDKPVENCRNYFVTSLNNIVCDSCKLGYALDVSNNVCTKCHDSNCALCDVLTCGACNNGFTVNDDGTCGTTSKCQTQNCNICWGNGTGACVICDSGYSLKREESTCVLGPSNCLMVLKEGDSKCFICHHGYYILSDGTCKANTELGGSVKSAVNAILDQSNGSLRVRSKVL
jgi:hypothetical protein